MDTHQITFAIQGMRGACAKCAVTIEQSLARLDGVIAAHVNYATGRAKVMFVPARVSMPAIIAAVQNEGFQIPLDHITLNVEGLLYAPSRQTVERVLSRVDDVVQVRVDLATQQIGLDVFSGRLNLVKYKPTIAKLGLRAVEHSLPDDSRKFIARTLLIFTLAILSLFSAGAHAGLYQASFLHAPIIVIVVSALVVYGIGWRFFHQAYDTCIQGEFDTGVLLALGASVALFGGLLVALASPSTWFTDSGFVLATLLTAVWFIGRAVSVWVLPRVTNGPLTRVSLAQAQSKVASNGNHP